MVPELLFYYRFRDGSMSWPWSEGQEVGTLSMVRDTVSAYVARSPEGAQALARALYSSGILRPNPDDA